MHQVDKEASWHHQLTDSLMLLYDVSKFLMWYDCLWATQNKQKPLDGRACPGLYILVTL